MQNRLFWIRAPPRETLRPIWRKSNDVLDVPCVGSPVEGKSDNKNDDTDHFEVGSGDEGHEHHADGRHQESQGSVHLKIKMGLFTTKEETTDLLHVLPRKPALGNE